MDLCWQSNVSAFEYAVHVGHNFPSKEQASFNFMAAITTCSAFGAQKNTVYHCLYFSPFICHEVKEISLEYSLEGLMRKLKL